VPHGPGQDREEICGTQGSIKATMSKAEELQPTWEVESCPACLHLRTCQNFLGSYVVPFLRALSCALRAASPVPRVRWSPSQISIGSATDNQDLAEKTTGQVTSQSCWPALVRRALRAPTDLPLGQHFIVPSEPVILYQSA
jgi:hypothetical protein